MSRVKSDEPPDDGSNYVGFLPHGDGRWRWWRSQDPGDVFELITGREFDRRAKEARESGLRVVDLELYEEV